MRKQTVQATEAQERRRRLAFRLDDYDLPDWVNRALCVVVGRGHWPIYEYGAMRCAWCPAEVSETSPDTLPRQWFDDGR